MQRKLHVLMIIGLLCALLLPVTAAGQREAERETITMWFWGAAPEYRIALDQALVQPYNASQDRYQLVITYDNAVDNNIATALAADRGAPDVVYGSGPAFVSQYAQAGKLVDLTPYAEKFGWEDRILEPIYKAGQVDGKLYSLPGGTITMGIFYNRKVLDELRAIDSSLPSGPPRTFAEVEAFMDTALANGYYASVTGNKGWKPVNENYSTIFLNTVAGPENVYRALNQEMPWTDQVFADAVRKSAEWYQKGYLAGRMVGGRLVIDYPNLNFDESSQLLAAGRAPFFFGPSMAFQFMNPYFTGDKISDLGFVVFPMDDAFDVQSYVLGTVNSFSVWAGSKHQDEAARIIDIMMTPEFTETLARVWPGYWALPLKTFKPNTAGYSDLSKAFVQATSDMYEAVNQGNFGIHISTFFPPFTQEALIDIDRVWLGDQSVTDYLNRVQREFNRDADRGSIPVIPQPAGVR